MAAASARPIPCQRENTPMPTLDLSRCGFNCQVELQGTVEESWLDGNRLVFLFGENHRDRAMKRINVLEACRLIDVGVVGCVSTEVPMADLDQLPPEDVRGWSRELFETYRTDEGVIDYLSREQPWRYGIFQFGSTVRLLRPSIPVRCVEDPRLREEMQPIGRAYELWDLGCRPHPFPEYPNMEDHPHNRLREAAMICKLLTLWDLQPPVPAAILNTGSSHSRRIANGLREAGISYYLITRPVSPDVYGVDGRSASP